MSDVYPNTLTKILEDVKLKDGILIQCFPGQGYVGKIAGMQLIDYFNAKKAAKIYSSYFPHVVFFQGRLGKLIHAELYVIKETNPPLVVLTGETQPQEGPEGMFQVLGAVLDLAEKWELSRVIAIGGFRPADAVSTPDITAFAYTEEDAAFLEENGISLFTEGRVSGAVGVLTALAAERGFKSYGVMGKVTPGERGQVFIDPQASKNVLITLSKIFGFEIDFTKMDEMIAKIEKAEASELKAFEELAQQQERSDRRNYYI
jgi:proteasome assembly chaperone (PAC2) family protein